MSSISPSPSERPAGASDVVERRVERIEPGPMARLSAVLDHPPAPVGNAVPPLGHWMYFLPADRQSALGPDGHAEHGALLPHLPGTRRMWAGGRLDFLAPLPLGAEAARTSRCARVENKQGRSGSLTFVTLRHDIHVAGEPVIREEQDLVFRKPSATLPPPPDLDADRPSHTRRTSTNLSLLMRFSALLFNAHRIHYDRGYAVEVEGFPGVVVHGPLQATLLLDHLLACVPGVDVARFEYRGVRPLFVDDTFELNLAEADGAYRLWTRDSRGFRCMTAVATSR